MHTYRLNRHGDVNFVLRKQANTLDDFWGNVDKNGECWMWTGATFKDGYGLFSYKKLWRAHRLSFTLAKGEIPEGLVVCHKCDQPLCVNPDHLFLGTPLDNTRDMFAKNRNLKTDMLSKLTIEMVRGIRADYIKGKTTHKSVAEKYGVCEETVGRIIRGTSWGDYV